MIKEVEKQDVENLKALSKRAITHSIQASPDTKQEIIFDTAMHIEHGISIDEHIFLKYVTQEEEILGFILLKNGWNLSDLFIEPKAHGKGLGKELFLRAKLEVASVNNRGYIRVNSSLNAEHFYRKLGFESFTPEKQFPDFVVPLVYQLPTAT